MHSKIKVLEDPTALRIFPIPVTNCSRKLTLVDKSMTLCPHPKTEKEVGDSALVDFAPKSNRRKMAHRLQNTDTTKTKNINRQEE
jgi:hypothetical protein